MIYYILLVIGLGIFEVLLMKKKELKKEIIIYISISLLSIAFAVYYFQNPDATSLSKLFMSLFGIEH